MSLFQGFVYDLILPVNYFLGDLAEAFFVAAFFAVAFFAAAFLAPPFFAAVFFAAAFLAPPAFAAPAFAPPFFAAPFAAPDFAADFFAAAGGALLAPEIGLPPLPSAAPIPPPMGRAPRTSNPSDLLA